MSINNNNLNANYYTAQINNILQKQVNSDINENEINSIQEQESGKYTEQGEVLLDQMSMLAGYNIAAFDKLSNSQVATTPAVEDAIYSLINENSKIEIEAPQSQIFNIITDAAENNLEDNIDVNIPDELVIIDENSFYITPDGIKVTFEDIEMPDGTQIALDELQYADNKSETYYDLYSEDFDPFEEYDESPSTWEDDRSNEEESSGGGGKRITTVRTPEQDPAIVKIEYTVEEDDYIEESTVIAHIGTKDGVSANVNKFTQVYDNEGTNELYFLGENNILTFSSGKTIDLNDDQWRGFVLQPKSAKFGYISLVRMVNSGSFSGTLKETYRLGKDGNILLYEVKQFDSDNNVVTTKTQYEKDGSVSKQITMIEEQNIFAKSKILAADVLQNDRNTLENHFVANSIQKAIIEANSRELQGRLVTLANWVSQNCRQGVEINGYLLATIGSVLADEYFKKNFKKL